MPFFAAFEAPPRLESMKFPVFSLLAGNLAFSETSSQLTLPSTRESDANLSFRVGTSSMPGNAAALVFFLFDLLHLDGEDLCPPI